MTHFQPQRIMKNPVIDQIYAYYPKGLMNESSAYVASPEHRRLRQAIDRQRNAAVLLDSASILDGWEQQAAGYTGNWPKQTFDVTERIELRLSQQQADRFTDWVILIGLFTNYFSVYRESYRFQEGVGTFGPVEQITDQQALAYYQQTYVDKTLSVFEVPNAIQHMLLKPHLDFPAEDENTGLLRAIDRSLVLYGYKRLPADLFFEPVPHLPTIDFFGETRNLYVGECLYNIGFSLH